MRWSALLLAATLGACAAPPPDSVPGHATELTGRIREGTPWINDCLTHGVVASMSHHFAVHPEASTD